MSESNKSNTALALAEPASVAVETQFSAFGSITHFESAQRMATALCSSSIVPEAYRGKERIGDCVIALEISNRIGASVLAVMQNLYIVYGKPAWSSQFLISCVNASRKFTPLRYKMTGEKGQDSWGCIAWAQDRSGEVLESPEVNVAMAKAEGWYQKNGSKWKTMPELMLRYRAATLFARLYAPELTMGIQTDEEIIDISPVVTDPVKRAKQIAGSATDSPKFTAPATPATPSAPVATPTSTSAATPAAKADEAAESELGLAPERKNAPANDGTPQRSMELFMADAGVTFEKFRKWAGDTERLPDADSYPTWSFLPADFCLDLAKDTKSLNKCITRCKS